MHTGDVSCSREVEEEEVEVAMGPLLFSSLLFNVLSFPQEEEGLQPPTRCLQFSSIWCGGGTNILIVCTYVGKDSNRGR